jgi:hypothetical protein
VPPSRYQVTTVSEVVVAEVHDDDVDEEAWSPSYDTMSASH